MKGMLLLDTVIIPNIFENVWKCSVCHSTNISLLLALAVDILMFIHSQFQ